MSFLSGILLGCLQDVNRCNYIIGGGGICFFLQLGAASSSSSLSLWVGMSAQFISCSKIMTTVTTTTTIATRMTTDG